MLMFVVLAQPRLTQSQGLYRFLCCPASVEAGDAQEAERGHSQDS